MQVRLGATQPMRPVEQPAKFLRKGSEFVCSWWMTLR